MQIEDEVEIDEIRHIVESEENCKDIHRYLIHLKGKKHNLEIDHISIDAAINFKIGDKLNIKLDSNLFDKFSIQNLSLTAKQH